MPVVVRPAGVDGGGGGLPHLPHIPHLPDCLSQLSQLAGSTAAQCGGQRGNGWLWWGTVATLLSSLLSSLLPALLPGVHCGGVGGGGGGGCTVVLVPGHQVQGRAGSAVLLLQ